VSSVDTEDEKLLALLRAEVCDQAPPPVHTALDNVVRRGRRRLRARRLGAALGVVAVVTGVGIATSVLRANLPDNQLSVASTSTPGVVTTTTGWTSSAKADTRECANGLSVPGEPKVDPVDVDKLNKVLIGTIQKVAPKASTKITRSTVLVKPTSSDSVLASTWADVTDSGGGGSVYVEVHGFSGTPVQAADSERFVDGDCTPPRRQLLPDGTVMQLYTPLSFDPGHPSQALRVYTPTHRLFIVTSEGFASPDWTQVANAEPGTLIVPKGAGRHSLPLTEDQLTVIAQNVAAAG
jgi:hypothetical protein